MSHRLQLRTTPERSKLMSRVRQTGTSPELIVRKLLRSMGYGYRVKAKDLPGSPDIVNRSRGWAIFVNGCYWHAHRCNLWKIPKTNSQFWTKKFEANRKRDKRKSLDLKRRGFKVLTLWQCELNDTKEIEAKLFRFLSERPQKNVNEYIR
jgi:DNA mismatch endonuclease, patch repair protein